MTAKFGYRGEIGPENWGQLDPKWVIASRGKNQSPIDLNTSAACYTEDLKRLEYHWSDDDNVKVINNGISPTFHVTPGKHLLKGGPVSEQYEMVQFHIHFSNSPDKGSEHTVDGKYTAAEIHFVHYKKSYGSFANAVTHRDGLAVVGALIGVDNSRNLTPELNNDIRKLTSVVDVGSEKRMVINLSKYNLPDQEFYTYPGSLTTPGCNECVVWIVLKDPLYITEEAYDALKSLKSQEGGLLAEPGNYRPVQPLNDRKVNASFK